VLNEELRTGEEVLRSFVEHEAQRTDIYTMTASFASIQELYVTVLVEPEFKTLWCVVYFGSNYGVGHVQLCGILLINVQ
jgi:hypothetical protein